MDYEVKADMLDASFGAIEAQSVTDEVSALRDEVAKLSGRLDGAVRAAGRPVLAGATTVKGRDPFTEQYLRKGVETMEQKSFAVTTGSGTDGGYAVPKTIDASIQDTLRDISPIRRIANVVQVGTSNYRRLITINNVASGWVTETMARPDSATLKMAEIVPPMGELYANPSASQNMLDDAMFDLENWLAMEIASEFARAEGQAFVKGTGVGQPLGFLTSPSAATADGTRAFGSLQYLATGTAGAFPAATPQDTIINLIHKLRPAYRQNATFVMNSTTLSLIRRMKDSTGAFIWQPSMAAGVPDTLFGYPVVDAEDMPDIATGSFSIAFGDFKAGYLIAERAETRVLRDPYSNKPYVNFYATKRVSGIVANSEAIKLLKFDVS